MIKTRKVKDDIHGYIHYSNLEGLFISHPLVLRLHQIRQNGAAYLTYPTIRVHRYEHSLGAMHLAGQLMLNAIRFSTDDGIRLTIQNVVEKICQAPVAEIRTTLQNTARDGDTSFITEDGLYHLEGINRIDGDSDLSVLLLYQAIRIAMLVHDIGHPPFSHTFEMGLKQLGVGYEDHERVGLDLLDLIIKDIVPSQRNIRFTFANYVARLVVAIVNKASPDHKLVKGVASIVSGDIDADRLDYVKRDALSGGLSTNSYDVGRLFDAMKLVTRDGAIEMEFHAAAMSTFEAFFSMRLHLYRWMLWHHSVIMRNMTLVSITLEMHKIAGGSSSSVSQLAKEVMTLALDKGERAKYWYFTDSYFVNKITEMYNHIVNSPRSVNLADVKPFVVDVETFLLRSKKYIVPFWKRPDAYHSFAKDCAPDIDGGHAAKLNKMLDKKYTNIQVETRKK